MNEISSVIDTLEARLEQLMKRYAALERTNRGLSEELLRLRTGSDEQRRRITELEASNETLRHANSLLGSEENKRETKLKINALIREIDHCIAQLAD